VFVTEEVSVGTGLRAGQARFANLLHGSWLAEVSEAAYDGGLSGLLRVGPPARLPGSWSGSVSLTRCIAVTL
jgi:hypothetical protein